MSELFRSHGKVLEKSNSGVHDECTHYTEGIIKVQDQIWPQVIQYIVVQMLKDIHYYFQTRRQSHINQIVLVILPKGRITLLGCNNMFTTLKL